MQIILNMVMGAFSWIKSLLPYLAVYKWGRDRFEKQTLQQRLEQEEKENEIEVHNIGASDKSIIDRLRNNYTRSEK